MFKKGDIIIKVMGARRGRTATVTHDQGNDDCVRIEYSPGDTDYSPESYCLLHQPELELDFDVD